ncbi:hypothetical protein L0P96_15495 [Anoxybacillus flavithermus]
MLVNLLIYIRLVEHIDNVDTISLHVHVVSPRSPQEGHQTLDGYRLVEAHHGALSEEEAKRWERVYDRILERAQHRLEAKTPLLSCKITSWEAISI